MKNEKTDGGFEYAVSDEALREHRKLSAWDKLRWLRRADAGHLELYLITREY